MLTQSYHLTLPQLSNCTFSVARFQLTEQLNQFSQLSIQATATQDWDLARLIGQTVLFSITSVSADVGLSTSPLRFFHGQIVSCERLSVSVDEIRYRLLIHSRFAVLNQHRTSRLFQNQNVPDIIADLLRKHSYAGNDFRFQLSRSYPIREYVTQYDESDAQFIQRLCEEEGIWFYFAQYEDRDVWTFADDMAHYQRTLPIYPFRENAGLESVGEEAVHALQLKQQAVLSHIRVDEYNYRRVETDLSAQWQNPESSAVSGSINVWGLHHKTPEEAQTYTRLLREYSQSRQLLATGQSNVVNLTPSIILHTQPSVHEQGWLIISAVHHAARDEAYSNTFTAISAGVPFRPERLTPQPKVAGSLNARIVSPDNYTYAYIDDMGRYRVKLPFDLDEWSPGGDSRPVRLAKPYAGPSYGQHFPLHEGTEVMLSFIQGNPDRPYISGVVHDSKNQEHVNNEWNTRNVIRTWANNKLRMEDKQGQEHIKLATEYGKTQLNLGHLVDKERNKRGEGFELRTDNWGAIRAANGLFLSTHPQAYATGEVLDMEATIKQLQEALEMAQGLAMAAKKAEHPVTDESSGNNTQLLDIGESYLAQKPQLDKQGLSLSGLIASATHGIALSTPKNIQSSATENLIQTAGNSSHTSVFKRFTASAGEMIQLFAQKLGIKLIAVKGNIQLQAQSDSVEIAAAKQIRLDSVNDEVIISAAKKITLLSGGAYITLSDGNIELGAPNGIINRSSSWQKVGPNSQYANSTMPKIAKGQLELFHYYNNSNKDGVKQGKFTVTDSSGNVKKGILDNKGYAVVNGLTVGAAKVIFEPDPRDGHQQSDIVKTPYEQFTRSDTPKDFADLAKQFQDNIPNIVQNLSGIPVEQGLNLINSVEELVKQSRKIK